MEKLLFIVRTSLLAAALLCSQMGYAQKNQTVSGTVKDSEGNPVVGAVVMIEGTSTGAVADINGNYTITFTPKQETAPKLIASSIGYKTETVFVAGRARIDILLEEELEELEETVVVGYGSMKKSDLTGSVTSVSIDENKSAQSTSIDQLLRGRAAGVQVVSNSAAPDAAVNITIRGASSFNSNSQPLYVVDGVLMNMDSHDSMSSNAGSNSGIDEATNGLIGINPQDIASIEILKDASATAIYGSQGANGVILITTKSAVKEKSVITYSQGVSINTVYRKFNLMDVNDFIAYLDMKGISHESDLYTIFTTDIEGGRYEPVDWQDYTTQDCITQRYNLTISGKPKTANYHFSLGYSNNPGVIRGTGYSNLTTRLNFNKRIGLFTFGTKTSLSYLDSKMTQGLGSSSSQSAATSLIMSMLLSRPIKHIMEYDIDGDEIDDGYGPLSDPVRWLGDYQSERTELRLTPSFYAQYKIFPWLTFKSSFGADYRSSENQKFKSKRINTAATGSTGSSAHIDRLNWNWDNLLFFDKKIKKHNISGTLGQSASTTAYKNQMVEGTNIPQWKSMASSLNSAPNTWLTYTETQSQLLSFFARMVYNYDNRYVLTATYRFDGSSKFAGKNKWSSFPSFAFAWRLNDEPWFNVPVISMAKLRLGWGMVGNQGIPSYQTIYRYTTNTVATHDKEAEKDISVASINLPSKDLKWETTIQYNVGLDYGMFNGKFTLSADLYYKRTDDLLQTKTLQGSAGVTNPYVNMGSIENKGFEITANAFPVATKDMEWSIGGNFSLNRNKILSINDDSSVLTEMYVYKDQPVQHVEYFSGDNLSGSSVCRDYVNVFIKGLPMCMFYGLPTDGIVPEGQHGVPFSDNVPRGEGSVNFIDTNGDGVITAADRVIIGNPNPAFTYGFNTSFRFKRITASVAFQGSYGNDIFNQQAAVLTDVSTNSANRLREAIFNCWSPERPDAVYPSLSAFSTNDISMCTDRYVEDGSYLRLSDASIVYELPFKKKGKKEPFVKSISVGVSGKNLHVWTRYSGYDPDVNVYGSVKKYGIDLGSYPPARSYMFDLKITF